MGFRVGSQCFASESGADDHFFSQQDAIQAKDGFYVFQKFNDKWYRAFYQDGVNPVSVIEAPKMLFPECSPAAEFAAGAGVGLAMLAVLALVWGYRQIGNFFGNDN